ncbi:hypothetical protein [Legionella worsleiensis]|nr:hypothetical protein [Legionella worsleiensis]
MVKEFTGCIMGVTILKVLLFLLCILNIQISGAAPKILIKRYENWSHPVLSVFKKNRINLSKVSYSVDGTCPTFHVILYKNHEVKDLTTPDYNSLYSELLKANSYFPYALVDEKYNVKINVGWRDKNHKTMAVDVKKMPSVSLCLGNEHAHVDDYANYDPFTVDKDMKNRIMNSPFSAELRRGDGKKFIVYIYANNEQIKSEENYDCDGKIKQEMVKTGNYYLYLYDVSSNSFYPGRIPIFNEDYKNRMNVLGANIFVLSSDDKKQSDVLLISQFGSCSGDHFEAYGFTENQLFLKKYFFIAQERKEQFIGYIKKDKKTGKLLAYGKYNTMKSQNLNIFISKTPGAVQLQPYKNELVVKRGG